MSTLSPPPIPSDRALDEAVESLALRGDHVGVVQIVEAWSANGAPTQSARLHAGRAFLHLRLMDRATSRAREVLEQEPGHPGALELLARVFIERGWPAKARQPLTQLRDAGVTSPEIAGLWARAVAPPVRPETNARQIEREGDPARLLELAEAFLATGSFLRATGLLERLRRAEPDHPRVRELLWGLAGDFGLGGQTLGQFVRAAVPVPALPPIAADEPEHTDSWSDTTQNDRSGAAASVGEALAFPSLFKHGPRPTDDGEETGEHTAAAMMARPGEVVSSDEPDLTDGGSPAAKNRNDTQIMLVLRPGEDVKAAHKRRDGARDTLRESLNLREYQASMGMNGLGGAYGGLGSDIDVEPEDDDRSEARGERPADDDESDEDLLEEEDENLVVLTRMEGGQPPPDPPTAALERPIEVIEKHPVPISAPPPAWSEPPPAEPAWTPPASNRWLILGLALGALAMMAAVAAIVGSRLWSITGGGDRREELVEVLATADYDRLLEAESVLDAQLQGKTAPDVAAALAEARLVLWSDFNGDPARMEFVERVLAEPEGLDTHRLAMLRAALAWAREDYAGAAAAISRQEPGDDEERLLYARLAARTEDPSRALEHFTRMSRPDAPRYAIARADILAGMGKQDEATEVITDLLRDEPTHVLAHLARARLTPGEPKHRIAAADLFLQQYRGRSMAPRIEGEAHAIRARAYARFGVPGKARESADAGLARDGTNPSLLLVVAEDDARRGDLLAALSELETITTARPGNAEAQAARVLVLLDLDRVDQAEAVVTELRTQQLLPDLSPILQGLVTVWGRSQPPAVPLGPKESATPLGSWLAALMAVQARTPDAPAAAARAVELLAASPAPFEARLTDRARALTVLAARPEEAQAVADRVEAVVAADPVAHVLLGRHYEETGRRALAAQHFDRAAELGPQLGLAWYEKGRFYRDARDSLGRSAEAWRAYLKLGPSGPRAERATARR